MEYYLSQIPMGERKLYSQILKGLTAVQVEFAVDSADQSLVSKVFEAVLKDHPEIFWCSGAFQLKYYSNRKNYGEIHPVFLYNATEIRNRQKKIADAVRPCLTAAAGKKTAYDKILYVFEFLVEQTEYNSSAKNNQNIDSVFIGHYSVCAGYAKAAKYLLDQLGIPTIYVTGIARGVRHAWNILRSEGEYYHLDVTWGDPVFSGGRLGTKENICYDYFCCTDQQIRKTHKADTAFKLPVCSGTKLNYYVANKSFMTTFKKDEVWHRMCQDIDAKKDSTELRFANDKVYKMARNTIINELLQQGMQRISSKYKVRKVTCNYSDRAEENALTIHWSYR